MSMYRKKPTPADMPGGLFTAAELERRRRDAERPLSRRTDPATSKAAARRVSRSGSLRGQKLAIVRVLCMRSPGEDMTCAEIAEAVTRGKMLGGGSGGSGGGRAMDHVAVARRMGELVRVGVVVVVRERDCSVRGESMRAYAVSAAQRQAMEGEGEA